MSYRLYFAEVSALVSVMSRSEFRKLDDFLLIIGDFGKYQLRVFSLVCIAVILHSAVHNAFVFIALYVPHRWEILKNVR